MDESTRSSLWGQLELLPQGHPCQQVMPDEGAATARPESVGHRGCISVDMRGLRPRMWARAAQEQTTVAGLVRRALLAMLDDGGGDYGATEIPCKGAVEKTIRMRLRLSSAHAASLAERARAADVAPSKYVCGLLDGQPPMPLAADHADVVEALRVSTDRVAAMNADLNAFLRLLGFVSVGTPGRVQACELESYRAGLTSLAGEMRAHLATASALFAELKPARRARR